MGERFIQARARGFKQQQCRHYQLVLKEATLYSRTPDVLHQSYCCESTTPVYELIGKQVLVKPCDDGVAVIHGNVEIGRVVVSDAAEVARAIGAEPHCPGLGVAVIEDASAATTAFEIRLLDHTQEDE